MLVPRALVCSGRSLLEFGKTPLCMALESLPMSIVLEDFGVNVWQC